MNVVCCVLAWRSNDNCPKNGTVCVDSSAAGPKDVDSLSNSVDPGQTAPVLGLHCLLRHIP